jgi:hypothetical protein
LNLPPIDEHESELCRFLLSAIVIVNRDEECVLLLISDVVPSTTLVPLLLLFCKL